MVESNRRPAPSDSEPVTDGVTGAPVKSAARTIELLELLASARHKMALPELHEQLGYPKSSLHVLLQTLRQFGWVESDHTGRYFGLGVRALLVGTSYIDGDEAVAAAHDTMDWLNEETTETVHFARLDGADVVYLATRESHHYLRPFSRVGRRLGAHATGLGKAILAERDDATVAALLPDPLPAITERTLVTLEDLTRDLAETRRRGYSVDHEENTLGLQCFGVAVHMHRPADHAISCSIPLARLDAQRAEQLVDALLKARDEMERRFRGLTP